jgi:hypothetical protein
MLLARCDTLAGDSFGVLVEHVDPRPDAQHDVIAGELFERRRFWIVRRRLVWSAVAGDYHRSIGHGNQRLTVVEVAGQTGGVSDPGPMAPIKLDPINGKALRDDLVTVHDEQTPPMMRVLIAAPLGRHPDAAAHARTQHHRRLGPQQTRPTRLAS